MKLTKTSANSGTKSINNADGEIYIGEFRKGTNIREGRGIFITNRGDLYEGFWIDDDKFGTGRMIMKDGSIYQGHFKEGKYHGKGIFCSPKGIIYKGEWANNKCNGTGYERFKDGSSFYGTFQNGK